MRKSQLMALARQNPTYALVTTRAAWGRPAGILAGGELRLARRDMIRELVFMRKIKMSSLDVYQRTCYEPWFFIYAIFFILQLYYNIFF